MVGPTNNNCPQKKRISKKIITLEFKKMNKSFFQCHDELHSEGNIFGEEKGKNIFLLLNSSKKRKPN